MSIFFNDWWEVKRTEIKNEILKKFDHSTLMGVTDIEKIVVNSGVSNSVSDRSFLDKTEKVVSIISFGQKPVITHARKSITNFKLRENVPIGCKVTLRKKRAWGFLFELINIDLIRIPNFRGISESKFDRFGNFNFGINNMNIFPLVPYDLIFKNQGIQVTIVFKSSSVSENIFFLKMLNFPFKKINK